MTDATSTLIDAINKAVNQHTARMKSACARFHIALDGRSYPERSFSHFYLGALAAALDGGAVIAEVPFPKAQGSIPNNHLDAIVFNDDFAILAEFKRSWTPSHWQDLALDVDRVHRFADNIQSRFRDNRERTLIGFYGCDSYRSQAADVWTNGGEYNRWKLPHEFLPMKRSKSRVWHRNDDPEAPLQAKEDGYYWLWACEQLC